MRWRAPPAETATGSRMSDAPGIISAEHDRRVDYVEFGAPDLSAVKEFYRAVFGWQFTDYGPDYTSFEDGRLAGGFVKSDEARTGRVLVVMFAVDLAAMEQRVRSAGGRIVKPIFSFPGVWTASVWQSTPLLRQIAATSSIGKTTRSRKVSKGSFAFSLVDRSPASSSSASSKPCRLAAYDRARQESGA